MSQVLSDAHREHWINTGVNPSAGQGHRVQQLADHERPIQFPDDVELFVVTVGADGTAFFRDMPRFGGPVIYRVLPTSRTAGWAIRERANKDNASRMRTAHTLYSAVDVDVVTGLTFTCTGGRLLRAPQTREAGHNPWEFVIHYQVIIPSGVDGVNFGEGAPTA